MKIDLKKVRHLKDPLELKKRADRAHRNIHKRSIQHTRRHITSRVETIKSVKTRRLVISWTAKFVLVSALALLSFSRLNSAGRFVGFKAGSGVIVGVQDESTKLNLNPLTLSTPGESAIGELIYSSILKYDNLGKIKGDLAQSFTNEEEGKKFKIALKDGIKWHDGQDLTSEDIVFTVKTLKERTVNSSLRDSLVGVDAVATDPLNLEITTTKAVIALDDLLTRIKIAPKHLFEGVAIDKIASVNYNQLPVGSGPYEVAGDLSIRENATIGIEGSGTFQQLSLAPNNKYYENAAQADLTFRLLANKDDLGAAFSNGSVEMYIGSGDQSAAENGVEEIKLKLSSGVFSFFNIASPTLKDVKVRRALSSYIDRNLLNENSGGTRPLYSPVLEVGNEPQVLGNPEDSKKLITEAGWQFNAARSVFVKDGQDLKLNIVTGDSDEYSKVVDTLVKAWREIGVDAEVVKATNSELQSNYFVNKTYDVLLYGISLDEASDPYAYWSSSAATATGLNFSNYKSPASDADLDIARTKLNPVERNARLDRFVKRWKEDVPAAALYVPSVKVVYRSGTVQPEPNQEVSFNGFADTFDFLTQIKAQKTKLYQTE